jgi:hypothetical protein
VIVAARTDRIVIMRRFWQTMQRRTAASIAQRSVVAAGPGQGKDDAQAPLVAVDATAKVPAAAPNAPGGAVNMQAQDEAEAAEAATAPGATSSLMPPVATSGRSTMTTSTGRNAEIEFDRGPLRATGLWKVAEVQDEANATVNFRHIDDVESAIAEDAAGRDTALVVLQDEQKWRERMMFVYKFEKTPKHLTWKEFGQEVECLECVIDLDDHRPEELYSMSFFFKDKKTGGRDCVWKAKCDVSYSEALTDLLAAIGSCLGRADVHRTIRFDDGSGVTREINLRKNSRYTSEVVLAFRTKDKYDLLKREGEKNAWEVAQEDAGLNTWGFHPTLMDPEYRDVDDDPTTYHMTISAHAFSCIVLKAIDRLIKRPLKDFYRPSQIANVVRVKKTEDLGMSQAMKGWLGVDDKIYPHYTPMEAIQDHWLGADAPFTVTAVVNKLREMTYLKKENPELQSWLGVRRLDTTKAVRNMRVKMLGAGASPLFAPMSHNATVNQLLPKDQRRKITASVSLAGAIGMPDETRRIAELRAIAQTGLLPDAEEVRNATSNATKLAAPAAAAAEPKGGAAATPQK